MRDWHSMISSEFIVASWIFAEIGVTVYTIACFAIMRSTGFFGYRPNSKHIKETAVLFERFY
ncbi:hypothetical protein D3C80_943240 [compost metagenome]